LDRFPRRVEVGFGSTHSVARFYQVLKERTKGIATMAVTKIQLIHATYSRIGFTDYQETVFRQHSRILRDVVEACKRTELAPERARFRWTCDATGVLQYAFANESSDFSEAWTQLAQEGLVEVTALPFHLSPLATAESLAHYLYPVEDYRRRGIPIRSAMVAGVNGVASALIDLLAPSGVPYLFVVSSDVRATSPLPRSGAAWWESLSGERLLVWNAATPYETRQLGIGKHVETAQELVAEYLTRLERQEYPYDFVALPIPGGRYASNAGVDASLSAFIQAWNERAGDDLPTMEFAVPSTVLSHLETRYGDSLRVVRGEWGDWWADGVASSAYETALQRRTHALANIAERLSAGLSLIEKDSSYPSQDLRETFWNLALFDEHTWGSAESVSAPSSLASRSQWNAKAGFVYRATHLARDIVQSACEQLADYVTATEDGVLVCNPVAWTRDAYVHLPRRGLDTSLSLLDLATGAPTPKWITDQGVFFVVRDLPPLGYKVYRWTSPASFPDSVLRTEGTSLENRFYRITVDPITGVVSSWFDKELSRELLDERSDYGLAQILTERISGDQGREALYEPAGSPLNGTGRVKANTPFVRTSATVARVRSGRQSPLAASLISEFVADGFRRITQEVTLYEHSRWIDIDITVDKIGVENPESVYIVFPFFIPGGTARFDSTGGDIRAGVDTLRGSCHDWHFVQRWVDFSNASFGVTVASPDAPLAQFGRINTGRWQREFVPKSATLFSWVMNNYWHTGYRASQDGELRFRYRLTSHAGDYDPVAATRFGHEAIYEPIVREIGRHEGGILPPETASILQVEPANVVLTVFKKAEDGNGFICHLSEVGGRDTVLSLTLPALRSANRTTPLEVDGDSVPRVGNRVICHIGAYELLTLRIV
jgi:hypothetical protein